MICFVFLSVTSILSVTSVSFNCVNYVSLINKKYSCRIIEFENESSEETVISDVMGKDVEGWTHRDIKQLYINNQSMKSIPNGLNNYFPELLKITLWNSKLENIQEKNFEGLTNLVELYLSHNLISIIDETVFRSLRNLEVLVLSYNKITNLKSKMFKELTKLKVIELKSNRLEVIEDKLFQYNPNLQEIELSNNNINIVKPEMLLELNNFMMINLQKNKCIDQLFILNFNYKTVLKIVEEISLNCSSKKNMNQYELNS